MSGKKAADLLTKPNKTSIWSNSVLQNGADLTSELHQVVSSCIKLCQVMQRCVKLRQVVSSCVKMYQVVSSCVKLTQVDSSCVLRHREA
jgi:hypothetical protein